MTPILQRFVEAEVINRFDAHLSTRLSRLYDEKEDAMALTVALLSRALRDGHTAIEISEWHSFVDDCIRASQSEAGAESTSLEYPSQEQVMEAIRSSRMVRTDATPRDEVRPLELGHGLLSLRRLARYEAMVAENLRARAGSQFVPLADMSALNDRVNALFGEPSDTLDLQRAAALVALRSPFATISGGPGTGKTSTVAKMLALLVEQALVNGEAPPRIKLTAPTGKAAARLVESLGRAVQALPLSDAVRAAMPTEALTVHRCLGVIPGSTKFRHGSERPLSVDILLVDEVSMVDLPLMAKLLAATPMEAKLIFLGDKNQLASVEAGSVLADICALEGAMVSEFTSDTSKAISPLLGHPLPVHAGTVGDASPMLDSIVELTKSYRYGESSGIGALARAINAGDESRTLEVLSDSSLKDVTWLDMNAVEDGRLVKLIAQAYAGYLRTASPAGMLNALDRFRVLCAHRRGPDSVQALNTMIERTIGQRSKATLNAHYHGRPVMIQENNYGVRLYNGDVGVVYQSRGEMRAYFPSDETTGVEKEAGASAQGELALRHLSAARLPEHDTVFAMSIHKSQGSEFEHVLVVLPRVASPIVTRELLYTGVTRAKKRVTILADEAVIRAAIAQKVRRRSGLPRRLHAPRVQE